jgi:hypothetical protein
VRGRARFYRKRIKKQVDYETKISKKSNTFLVVIGTGSPLPPRHLIQAVSLPSTQKGGRLSEDKGSHSGCGGDAMDSMQICKYAWSS